MYEIKFLNGTVKEYISLNGANLRYADLSGVNLRYVDLRYADLSSANLSNADLRYADLSGADLRYTNLSGADLSGANLSCADLSGADLNGVRNNYLTVFYAMQCPETGSFIGYKKLSKGLIAEIKVTKDAKRSSATSRKCRCSKAKVLSITSIDKRTSYNEGVSKSSPEFKYVVGSKVKVDNFDEDRWNECSTGIHFFLTRDEAVNY